MRAVTVARTRWRGRHAIVVSNGAIRLTTLPGGGHIAELMLVRDEAPVSPLWSPPWDTMEPHLYREGLHAARYGSITEGKLLSGIAGHNICLDYFGSPSAEEAQQGLSQHGEAPSAQWIAGRPRITDSSAVLKLRAQLPAARLNFEREIMMPAAGPVVYIRETVTNTAKTDHFFHWTQHVTLGPPFLSSGEVKVGLPGTKGMTFPHGYDEGKALLRSGKEFTWPHAPKKGGGTVDLSRPLSHEGLGYVTGILLDSNSDLGFVAALNRRLRLLIAYCFRRADFPWVALWEENKGISAPPWSNRTVALGLEFGTTPLPVPRRENFVSGGPLFGVPTNTYVAAKGRKTVRYAALLVKTPEDFTHVSEIYPQAGVVVIEGGPGESQIRVQAPHIDRHLAVVQR